ncbi:MAG TPA: hypothetical protein ENN79_04835 [Desulfobacteraceae bacterium]|nr:hypothetical protein [Desulfobacteraceae bacterium]
MRKADKLLQKWTNNVPKEARVQDVETFINHFFPGMWHQERTSHIVITCEALKPFREYKPNGELTVAVKGGKRVKGFYIKDLVKAVRLLEELGEL